MGKIKRLSINLANKIAAGEVVERPASVVKELVENAIDAKSRQIFVRILEGGTRLIQVVDDGEGMLHEEIPLAFERHATSKIAEADDLETIVTLGFRGEALPSIASISKVSLVSKSANASEGAEILIEGGLVQSLKTVAAPQGSTFEVRDLFYNVPARRKFLKSQQTEMSHISRVLFYLALAHAEIHFRLTHGGRTIIDVPAVASFKERAFQLLGEKVVGEALEMSEASPIQAGLSLKAIFSRPPLKRNLKKEQYLFVNQRPIKSPLLIHAVYDAYKSYLMKGEEPFFILLLSIDPKEVDVNVHPAKLEVRFQNTTQIHQAIKNMIRNVLSLAGIEALDFQQNKPLSKESSSESWARSDRSAGSSSAEWVGWPASPPSESRPDVFKESGVGYQTKAWGNQSALSTTPPLFNAPALEGGDALSDPRLTGEVPQIRPLAQVYGTFLLVELDGELAMVDQHTAHERILFESFLSAWEKNQTDTQQPIEIQPLLIPQQIDLTPAKSAILKEHLNQFEQIGCKIEPFGDNTFLIRELPALIAQMDLEPFLNEVADDLIELGLTSKIDQTIRAIIASMACHGAVRAHQSMSFPEIKTLLQTYFERKTPATCPHGRPIVIRYPLLELEKRFRRK